MTSLVFRRHEFELSSWAKRRTCCLVRWP